MFFFLFFFYTVGVSVGYCIPYSRQNCYLGKRWKDRLSYAEGNICHQIYRELGHKNPIKDKLIFSILRGEGGGGLLLNRPI